MRAGGSRGLRCTGLICPAVMWSINGGVRIAATPGRPLSIPRSARTANRASMTEKRNRVRQSSSLAERLAADAVTLREQAARLEPGAERDSLLKKAHRNKMAADINTCLSSPGRRPPA